MPASLTQLSIITRKIIRFSIYAFILIVIIRITLVIGNNIYRHFFPEPPPPPTCAFGESLDIPQPENSIGSQNLIFSLETPQGDLPDFPEQAKIYFMPKTPPTIQALDLAKKKASALGFDPEGRELVETVFLFQNQASPSTLTMNIVSGIFSISYDLRANPTVLDNIPPSPEQATTQVRALLARSNLLKDDLSGPATHEFIKIQEGSFVPAISLSEADLIKINLFRKDYDELPSVTLKPREANVWFMISGSRSKPDQIIAAEYHYYPIEEKQSATYPIKTAQEAWEELTSGGAFVSNLGNNDGDNIVIRNIYLAYYDTGQYTQYYQPVVVFEGDNDFLAYVPAVEGCKE